MKLQPGIPVKDYPPKLRELAIKRIKEQNRWENAKDKLNTHGVSNLLVYSETPEKGDLWVNVSLGYEIADEWGEEINNYQIF